MYQYLLNMHVMGRLTETQVQNAVTKGYITQDEANMILATPKVG